LLIRVLFYTDTLENYINQLLANQNTSFRGDDFNLLNIKELKKLQSNELFSESPKTSLMNLKYLTQNNINKINQIHNKLISSRSLLDKVGEKIEDIKRNGFIANYMGTNILIEASYLNEYQDNFNSLVENILNIINNLNKFLDIINNSIINAKNIIQNLNLE
jgi:Mg2+ and Co2+ transporter CorA